MPFHHHSNRSDKKIAINADCTSMFWSTICKLKEPLLCLNMTACTIFHFHQHLTSYVEPALSVMFKNLLCEISKVYTQNNPSNVNQQVLLVSSMRKTNSSLSGD